MKRRVLNNTSRKSLYHIPLALFYSSLTKLFLLLSLSIWRATPTPAAPTHASRDSTWYRDLLEFFDEDKLDREWVVRNVLGGMAGGFGLRGMFDFLLAAERARFIK